MGDITREGLLLTLATQRAEQDYPFSNEFRMMVEQAAMAGNPDEAILVTELVATRKLEPDEGAAVNAVFAAIQNAVQSGSGQLVVEVAAFGLPLIAKWAEYLIALERHPRLDLSSDDDRNGA